MAHRQSVLFNSKSPESGYCRLLGSGMYGIPCCVVLQLLPLMFTPELAQTLTACPLGLSLTQLLPAAPHQTGP